MLRTLWAEWKWTIVGVLLLAYSVGVWNVSSGYTDNSYNKERLRHSEAIIELKVQNEEALKQVSKEMNESLKKYRDEARTTTRKLTDELNKDSRYSTCTVTDGVSELYKRKIESQ